MTAQLGTWPSGDVERIRHKALKTSSAPRDQGIAAKDNGGAESIADAQEDEGKLPGAAVSISVKFGGIEEAGLHRLTQVFFFFYYVTDST